MQNEDAAGRLTVEAHILVCRDCGNEVFLEHRLTKNAVVRKCASCGTRVSVQGSVALARVAKAEATFARTTRRIDPDPEAGKRRKAEADPPSAEDAEGDGVERKMNQERYVYFRSSLPTDMADHLDYILQTYRVQHLENREMRGQRWQGQALCNIAADWFAGAERWAIEIVDATRDAVAQEALRIQAAEGRALPRRRATRLANAVRDKLLEGLGRAPGGDDVEEDALPTAPFAEAARINAERAAERAAEAEVEAEDERVPDDGMLLDALRMARDELPDHMRHCMHVGGPERLKEFAAMHERSGGYLLRVRGDDRTKTPGGARPEGYVWLAEDLSELLDLGVSYDDVVNDLIPQPGLDVVELLPPDYGSEADNAWDMPTLASGREQMERLI